MENQTSMLEFEEPMQLRLRFQPSTHAISVRSYNAIWMNEVATDWHWQIEQLADDRSLCEILYSLL